jgi:hypothetical protein
MKYFPNASPNGVVMFDSDLEALWADFMLETLTNSREPLWEIDVAGNFVFKTKYFDSEEYLPYLAILSIEQRNKIAFVDGFDKLGLANIPVKVIRIEIDKFDLIVYVTRTTKRFKDRYRRVIEGKLKSKIFPSVRVVEIDTEEVND